MMELLFWMFVGLLAIDGLMRLLAAIELNKLTKGERKHG